MFYNRLPRSVIIDNVEYPINTDYRDILEIITTLSDDTISKTAKITIALNIFFKDEIPGNVSKAFEELSKFIKQEGDNEDEKIEISKPKLIDWEQDFNMICNGINKIIKEDVRDLEYMHWWTFLSYYSEIGEGQLQNVLNIRMKKSRGKKLEKWEQEYYLENKNVIDFKTKYTEEEKDLLKLLGL